METFGLFNAGKSSSVADVWAIGGGKGGTGKSFLTSNMGICLSAKGKKVVLIDADMGGANLHSFLGIRKPRRSLTEFFEQNCPLKELVEETGIDGIGLVSGDIGSLDSDSVKHTQLLKLLRHIRGIKADYVLVDLGSGSHSHTLDIFMSADRMIMAALPEITSVENMYHFVKNVFFRKLKSALGKCGKKESLLEAWKNRKLHGVAGLKGLVEHLRKHDPASEEIIKREFSTFSVHIILNQIRNSGDAQLGTSIKSICKNYLGIDARYSGYVQYDEAVSKNLNNGKPFLLACPSSHGAREIYRLTENLAADMQIQAMMV